MTVTIGVSLKTYLGHRDTLAWVRRVAALAGQRQGVELFVLPTFPAIAEVAHILEPTEIAVGAQDLAADDTGNQTGEVTGAVLVELGCRYVEIGHAERRHRFGETDQIVAAKTAAAFRHGLIPVLCVGETVRSPVVEAVAECVRQLHSALGAPDRDGARARTVIAYEPHWAIGQPEPASDDHIRRVVAGIRAAAHDSPVIYGGSAGPRLLTRLGDATDGLFLGRFAHDPNAYAAVLDEAQSLSRPSDLQEVTR